VKHSGAPSTGDIIRIDYQFGESRYALVVGERGIEIAIKYLRDYMTGWPKDWTWWIERAPKSNASKIVVVSAAPVSNKFNALSRVTQSQV
jgi:hypothetical protein